MKRIVNLILILLIAGTAPTHAQVGKFLKKTVEKKIEKEVESVLEGEEKQESPPEQPAAPAATPTQPAADQPAPEKKPELSWSKYDFVPGDEVIFEDDLVGEENGEFPSRWDLERGNVEVAVFDGANVIMFRDNAPSIVPYFREPQKDYLPDVFTIEFDLYYPGDGSFEVHLYDRKNQKSGSPSGYTDVEIRRKSMSFGQSSSEYPSENLPKERWMHVAIAYTMGKLKAYMDDTRLVNLPRIDFDPKGISLYSYHARNENRFFVKNVRIAKGGVKYYDRLMQDGKIIANGIRFETGKATLRPESMGIINEIFTLLKENPQVRFSVEGHTDNVGDDAFNQKLSEDRAASVKNKLNEMGIESSRLESKGWGETKPLSDNNTQEGRANNRRVEFVKL